VPTPVMLLPFCPPFARPTRQGQATYLPPTFSSGLPFLPLKRLRWGLATLAFFYQGLAERLQHRPGRVGYFFPPRGCRPPTMYGTGCRDARLRENGRQTYSFYITKHPEWSNVIPAAGTSSLALLPTSQETYPPLTHLTAPSTTCMQLTISVAA
jgi:hypothetical protein